MLFGFAGRAHQNLVLGRARLLGSVLRWACLFGSLSRWAGLFGSRLLRGPCLGGSWLLFRRACLGGPRLFQRACLVGSCLLLRRAGRGGASRLPRVRRRTLVGERLQRESFEMLCRGVNRSLLGRGSGSGALLVCLGRGWLVKQRALDILGGGLFAYLERTLQRRQVGFFDRLFAPARGDLRRAQVEHG